MLGILEAWRREAIAEIAGFSLSMKAEDCKAAMALIRTKLLFCNTLLKLPDAVSEQVMFEVKNQQRKSNFANAQEAGGIN